MKLEIRCLAAAAALVAVPALACEYPPMISVPEGQTATMDEMLAAQSDVKGYMAAMEEYLACLNSELEAGGEDAPDTFQALMVQRHNGAVAEMESVAAAFNDQLSAFREANSSGEE